MPSLRIRQAVLSASAGGGRRRWNRRAKSHLSQHFFQPDELIVLGQSLGAGEGADFDLAGPRGDGQVGDGRVFTFAAACGDDGRIAVVEGHLDGGKRFPQRARLVRLDEHAVGHFLGNPLADELRAGDEQVVADELHAFPQAGGMPSTRPNRPRRCRPQC